MSNINTSTEWRKFLQSPGSKATCMSKSWLLDGCPKCGCVKWQVTSDCWAYCDGCSWGCSTDYPFTNAGDIIGHIGFEND